ncbi:hypothetical protein [Paramagnetospirillum marisnigri]|nr:hypothetical protein [Paramagnetospirillum marisnigri]
MSTDVKTSASAAKVDEVKTATPTTPPKVVELDEADLDKVAGGKAGGKAG